MNKLEELLKDWVLDDKALEAQREIFARVPVSRHHEMDLRHKLSDFIEKSPKKPGVVAQMPVAADVGSGDERDELGSG